MPKLARLFNESGNQPRVAVAKCVHSNATGTIEIPGTRFGYQPATLTALKTDFSASISLHNS